MAKISCGDTRRENSADTNTGISTRAETIPLRIVALSLLPFLSEISEYLHANQPRRCKYRQFPQFRQTPSDLAIVDEAGNVHRDRNACTRVSVKSDGFAGILDRLMMNQIMRRSCGARLEFISRILAKRTKHVRYIAQLDISGLMPNNTEERWIFPSIKVYARVCADS